MAQPDNAPTYVVLPASFTSGLQMTLTQFTDFALAQREAIKQTAINDQQFYVYTSTHYTDKIEDWPQEQVDAAVMPIVVP